MRITNRMLVQSALRDLRHRLSNLSTAQEQAATGKRVLRTSDDPVAASEIMRLNSHLRDIEQFRRNAASGTTRLSTEDGVEKSMQELLQEARKVIIGAEDEPAGSAVRAEAITAINGIRDQIIALANTKLGDEYLFGGRASTIAPFLPDGTYTGDEIPRTIEIDGGVVVTLNHTGDVLFSGAIGGLDEAIGALENGTPEEVGETVVGLQKAADQVSLAQVEVGARLRGIEDVGSSLARRANDFLDRRQSLEEVDPAESLLKVMSAQSALEQAYEVVGRVLSADITKYLP